MTREINATTVGSRLVETSLPTGKGPSKTTTTEAIIMAETGDNEDFVYIDTHELPRREKPQIVKDADNDGYVYIPPLRKSGAPYPSIAVEHAPTEDGVTEETPMASHGPKDPSQLCASDVSKALESPMTIQKAAESEEEEENVKVLGRRENVFPPRPERHVSSQVPKNKNPDRGKSRILLALRPNNHATQTISFPSVPSNEGRRHVISPPEEGTAYVEDHPPQRRIRFGDFIPEE